MSGPHLRRIAALYVVVFLLLGTVGGGAYTHSGFTAQQAANDSIVAASDFTVHVGNVPVEPATVENTEDGGTFTVSVGVQAVDRVDTSRFELAVVGAGATLEPTTVTCHSTSGECELTFEQDDLVAATDSADTYDLRLRGWWEYDRDFVGAGNVAIVAGNDGDCAGNDDCENESWIVGPAGVPLLAGIRRRG